MRTWTRVSVAAGDREGPEARNVPEVKGGSVGDVVGVGKEKESGVEDGTINVEREGVIIHTLMAGAIMLSVSIPSNIHTLSYPVGKN